VRLDWQLWALQPAGFSAQPSLYHWQGRPAESSHHKGYRVVVTAVAESVSCCRCSPPVVCRYPGARSMVCAQRSNAYRVSTLPVWGSSGCVISSSLALMWSRRVTLLSPAALLDEGRHASAAVAQAVAQTAAAVPGLLPGLLSIDGNLQQEDGVHPSIAHMHIQHQAALEKITATT